MKTPLTKNLIIKHVGESAVILGNEYPYPEARPIILEAIQGPSEPPTLLCWTGKGYERLMPIADISDPTNITGCALKFDSTLDYIDVYKLASIDANRIEVSDGKLIGAEFAYEGRADVNDTQSLLLAFESGGGADILVNPETEEGAPVLSSIGIGGTDYDIMMPFEGIVNAVNHGIEFGAIDVSSREKVVPILELKDLMEALASGDLDEDRYPAGTPDRTTKFTTDMTYDAFETFLTRTLSKSVVLNIFSLSRYGDGTEYPDPGRFWNVYINDEFYQTRNGNAGGIAIEYDAESESGDLKVFPVEFEYKYVTLSILVYGKELVPNFQDEEM